MDWLETLLRVLPLISVIIGSVVAIWGINAWRREFLGKRRIELAEDALALFYEAEAAIRDVRAEIGYMASDVQGSENKQNEDTANQNAETLWSQGFRKHQETFQELDAMRFRFKAIFGPEAERPFGKIQGIVNRILRTARNYVKWDSQLDLCKEDSEKTERLWKHIRDADPTLWSSGDDDPLAKEVAELVYRMKLILEDALKRSYFRQKKSKTE